MCRRSGVRVALLSASTVLIMSVPSYVVGATTASAATPSSGPVRMPAPHVTSLHGRRPPSSTAPSTVSGTRPRTPDPAGLAAAKRSLNARATGTDPALAATSGSGLASSSPALTTSAAAPTPVSFQGVDDSGKAPSDSTGAIGTSRYVELVNTQYGIYDRSGSVIHDGNLGELTLVNNDDMSDPQIIWDYTTSHFYYVVLNKSTHHLEFGFSLSDSPSSASDFCQYDIDFNYGTTLPDYPKLGDTQGSLLIGVNAYPASGGASGDVLYVTKPVTAPGPVTTCPSALQAGGFTGLLNGDGSTSFTPVPVHQVDPSSIGYVLTTQSITSSPSNYVSLFTFTDGPSGPTISWTPSTLTVSAFSLPPDAQQENGTPLDTSDTRLTQAISAFDPAHNRLAIWTQHTVASPSATSSMVDWYEIDPVSVQLLQAGYVASSTEFVFNAAISPDRQMNGSSTSFGENMAIGFNTSSSSQHVAVRMVTKSGPYKQSRFQLIKSSDSVENSYCLDASGQNRDPDDCAWGDYSAATPDPAQQGAVWFTNARVHSRFLLGSSWRTWNWEAITAPSGSIARSITPTPQGNGRAMAINPTTGELFYTIYGDTNIYVVTTSGTPVRTLSSGVNFGALSWEPKRGVLWGGAYDGSGRVYTIDPATGAATLQFTFPFPWGDNCFGQQPGYIDGLAYDPTDGSVWLSDDGGTLLFHTDRKGTIKSTTTIPFGACNTGIAVVRGRLWLAILQDGSGSPSYFLLLDKANLGNILGQVPYNGPGAGPEGIAYDATTFTQSHCVLWTDNAGANNYLSAVSLQPLCP